MGRVPTLRVVLRPGIANLMAHLRRFYCHYDCSGLLAPDDQELVEAAIIALAERALADWPEGEAQRTGLARPKQLEAIRADLAQATQAIRSRRPLRTIRLRGGERDAQ